MLFLLNFARLLFRLMQSQLKPSNLIDRFREELKRHSLKATSQRLAAHRAMLALGHASADMVAEWIAQEDGSTVSVASVYNILTQMSSLGIYHHRLSDTNKMYFDVNTFKHLHLYDSVNHEYRDVIDDELMSMVENRFKGRRFKGYKLDCIDIQLVCHPTKKQSK